MFIDNNLVLSSSQAVTTTVASTSYIDQGAASDAVANGPWLVISIPLAFTSNSATIAFALESATDAAFTSPKVMFSTGALADTALTLGLVVARVRLPLGELQYLRVKYTVTGTAATGKISASIVADVDNNLA